MEWKKAPAELVDFIIEKMKDKYYDYKEMFGYPAYFFNAMSSFQNLFRLMTSFLEDG